MLLTCVSGWFNLKLSHAYLSASTAHFYIFRGKSKWLISHNFQDKLAWNQINSLYLTVYRSTPDSFAPKHNPVDIPPQPEYKSNSVNSNLVGLQVVIVPFELVSMIPLLWISSLLCDEDNPPPSEDMSATSTHKCQMKFLVEYTSTETKMITRLTIFYCTKCGVIYTVFHVIIIITCWNRLQIYLPND